MSADDQTLPVVGIGASAGGLEALEELFQEFPKRTGCAFVVIQHLSPDFKSFMPEILARKTALRVQVISDLMALAADTIYLLPPKFHVTVAEGLFRLIRASESSDPHKPIDRFFSSLANDKGNDCIAVILSGAGTDGSVGIQAIKSHGGTVLVESTAEAMFSGMPQSAIDSGLADFTGSPQEIAARICQTLSIGPPTAGSSSLSGGLSETHRSAICSIISSRHGVDFRSYKQSTLDRRIEHRRRSLGLHSSHDYLQYLQETPDESPALMRHLLIEVTSFFRDTAAFETLKTNALQPLLDAKTPHSELRIWVPGCASGEEAYSIGLLVYDALERKQKDLSVKIFATDIDGQTLDFAAEATYRPEQLESVPKDWQEKYFAPQPDGRQTIIPEVRKQIIFAQHDLISEPPFINLDLISCRNVLIYFTNQAQQTVLSGFHFGLRQQGVLFLGPSESLGPFRSTFSVIDHQWKLFRKTSLERPSTVSINRPHLSEQVDQERTLRGSRQRSVQAGSLDDTVRQSMELLLNEFVPSSFMVDSQLKVLYIFGDGGQYLRPQQGYVATTLDALVERQLAIAISSAVIRAKRLRSAVRRHGIQFTPDQQQPVIADVTVRPIAHQAKVSDTFLVSISASDRSTTATIEAQSNVEQVSSTDEIALLQDQLLQTQRDLQDSIETLESTNETLQSTNEELLASNEELQTTNEELHSVNEELYTVNTEHQNKIVELTQLTNDESNLINNTQIGVIFLTKDLRIRKFTPAISKSFNILPQDVGRPIDHITQIVEVEQLIDKTQAVLRDQTAYEEQVKAGENLFLMRILPYHTGQGIDGAILAFVDITMLTREQEQRIQQESFARTAIEASSSGIMMTDSEGNIILANEKMQQHFGYSQEELLGKSVEMLLPEGQRGQHKQHRREFSKHPTAREMGKGRALLARHRSGKLFPVEVGLTPVETPEGMRVISSIIDISEQVNATKQLKNVQERLQRATDGTNDGHWEWNIETNEVWLAGNFRRLLGYQAEELRCHYNDLIALTHPDDRETLSQELQRRQANAVLDFSCRLKQRSGEYHWYRIRGKVTASAESRDGVVSGSITDQHAEKLALDSLARSNRDLEQFAFVASHDLQAPLRHIQFYILLLKEQLSDVVSEDKREAFSIIDSSTAKMQSMISDLLKLSKARADELDLQYHDLNLITQDVLDLLGTDIESSGARIVVAKLPTLQIDAKQITFVFQNLIQNAIKFCEPGMTPEIEINSRRLNNEWELSIADNGIGIKPQHRERVFEIFQRLHGDDAYEGTGIGLAIVKRIIENHSGRIWIESGDQGGTKFLFTIPKAAKA